MKIILMLMVWTVTAVCSSIEDDIRAARTSEKVDVYPGHFTALLKIGSAWDFRAACVEPPHELRERFKRERIYRTFQEAWALVRQIETDTLGSAQLQKKEEELHAKLDCCIKALGKPVSLQDRESHLEAAWKSFCASGSDRELMVREVAIQLFTYVFVRSENELNQYALGQVEDMRLRVKAGGNVKSNVAAVD